MTATPKSKHTVDKPPMPTLPPSAFFPREAETPKPAFLQLTDSTGLDQPVYIAARAIVAMQRPSSYTKVWLADGQMFTVNETPEQICAIFHKTQQ